jgi:hypothetical protein
LNVPNLVSFFLYVERLPSESMDLLTCIFTNRLYNPGAPEHANQLQRGPHVQNTLIGGAEYTATAAATFATTLNNNASSTCGSLNLRAIRLLPGAGHFLCWLWLHEARSQGAASNLFVVVFEFLLAGLGRTHVSKSGMISPLFHSLIVFLLFLFL